MKKVLVLLIVVVLLSGCASSGGDNALYAELPTQPQSNESLWIYCDFGNEEMLSNAMTRFKADHPDVELKFTTMEYNSSGSGFYADVLLEQYQQLATQIMAGEGPDVFMIGNEVMDVEKMVRQGLFADLEPFFQADRFDWEPYNRAVMDGGVWNGKRFVVPLSYDFPLLFTTKTALEETGFDMEACKDSAGYMEETARYIQDPTQRRQLCFNMSIANSMDFLKFSGLSIADYDKKTIDLSAPEFQQGMEWFKLLQDAGADAAPLDTDYLSGAAAVRDGKALWTDALLGAAHGLYYDFAALKTVDEPVMMPIRNLDGGIQADIRSSIAVRANSENLQNAYDYIKILLSKEIQYQGFSDELHVLDAANAYFYEEVTEGRKMILAGGTQGFASTNSKYCATDPVTPEEFQEFLGLTREITGTQYCDFLNPYRAMSPYLSGTSDFEEAKQAAQLQMELYISE